MKKSTSKLQIGLSMRAMREGSYAETRDALDRRWYRFLSHAFPEGLWMGLPNVGTAILDHLESWKINGLILTGGQDIGDDPLRDETEFAMLAWALENNVPVLGVCRGLQLIHHHYSGRLSQVEGHVATRHTVLIQDSPLTAGQTVEVNSYHSNALTAESLPKGMTPLALDRDGFVEAFMVDGKRAVGVMWHPEREDVFAPHDIALANALFAGSV